MAKEEKSTEEEIIKHIKFHKEIAKYEQKKFKEKAAKFDDSAT